ncbi:DUF4942 domain-containing protein [Aureimonas sp. AU40]|uniref:DUF4942 domain-containing protein n=1 Tax=Aureimonas sp. AU40 TaxID=1637747 RepID=UPI0007814353|nr:DUF4942 domain-containing protein [Aureimonas sp. AU40]
MNAIVPRATIEEIVGHRNRAVALYTDAYEQAVLADDLVKKAREAWSAAAPSRTAYHGQHEEVAAFNALVSIPDMSQYVRTATRLIDAGIWASIIERTDLERLMDKEAKDKLREQMRYVPERVSHRTGEIINQDEIDKGLPPVTVENVAATLEHFMLDAETIWRRGIANAFAKLDRRFRSHDGWKIGSRVILTRCFNDWGSWSSYSNERETLIDIERIFTIMDEGVTKATYATSIGQIDQERKGVHAPAQTEVDTTYFKIRIFKNGNAHLWMKRDDLVEKVNKLLGEYYGDAIGDHENVPTDEDVLNNPKTSLAKNMGFFPTPVAVGERAIGNAKLYANKDGPPLRILEPSAGEGNIAKLLARPLTLESKWEWDEKARERVEIVLASQKPIVHVVELHPGRANELKGQGLYEKVVQNDFLLVQPHPSALYDRIVMNPPFDRDRDIDHVYHALKFLKEDGILVSVMSAGVEFRTTKKAIAFRELVEKRGGWFEDLPDRSFAESGTNINTVLCIIGRKTRW